MKHKMNLVVSMLIVTLIASCFLTPPEPATLYYAITPSDFTEPSGSSTTPFTYKIGYVDYSPPGIGSSRNVMASLIAPAHFPHGAVLKEITVYFYDDSPNELEIFFNRAELAGESPIDELVILTTSGTPGHSSISNTLDITVDNSTHCYNMVATGTPWDESWRLRIKGAVFKYTI